MHGPLWPPVVKHRLATPHPSSQSPCSCRAWAVTTLSHAHLLLHVPQKDFQRSPGHLHSGGLTPSCESRDGGQKSQREEPHRGKTAAPVSTVSALLRGLFHSGSKAPSASFHPSSSITEKLASPSLRVAGRGSHAHQDFTLFLSQEPGPNSNHR